MTVIGLTAVDGSDIKALGIDLDEKEGMRTLPVNPDGSHLAFTAGWQVRPTPSSFGSERNLRYAVQCHKKATIPTPPTESLRLLLAGGWLE